MPDFNQSLPLPTQPSDDPVSDKPADAVADDASKKDPALALIRSKVTQLYAQEPSAKKEESEIEKTGVHSKHQRYIQTLMASKKPLAEVQTLWHQYYVALPDNEKHAVWNEFYQNYGGSAFSPQQTVAKNIQKEEAEKEPIKEKPAEQSAKPISMITAPVLGSVKPAPKKPTKATTNKPKRSLHDTKTELLSKVSARGKLKPKHHLQSLVFGLGMGFIVITIFMFSFFNERFIAPFITPSRTASAGPIIIDPNAKIGPEPLISIPKINLEVPVVYDLAGIEEDLIQKGLESGAVHYPLSPRPGQNGNVVVVGHSSNNILNAGKYKFAFAILNYLEAGDTIIMQYDSKRYVYKVTEKFIVKPEDVSVLGPTSSLASLTLITCDPPGTNINRLIIRADQISPDPNSNVASTAPANSTSQSTSVPGSSPSLFSRLFGWL
ncbi:class D sortase [Candidatus Saccharibacteria bacterium]|nr:class D sortase [Candidatus Saccharibacteria bacterium]MDQ5885177.1 Sortase [Patescibacteria group bacterium]MDQ5953574.1 Sortase [Patescibacteria group bacterium]